VVCSLIKKTFKKKKKHLLTTKKVYISPTWGDASLELITTKFGMSLFLTEIINRSFGVG